MPFRVSLPIDAPDPRRMLNRGVEPFLASRKKNGRATLGEPQWGATVQVARPWLGDRRCWSRGRRLSALLLCQANIVPEQSRGESMSSRSNLFLFLRRETAQSLEFGHFFVKIVTFATCDRSARCDR